MAFNWNTNKINKVNLLDGTIVKQVDVLKNGVRTTVFKDDIDTLMPPVSNWTTAGYPISGGGRATITSNTLEFPTGWCSVGTANKIDITNYSKIKVYFRKTAVVSSSYFINVGLYNNKSDAYTNKVRGNPNNQTFTANEFVVEFDVASLIGSYYLAIHNYTNTGAFAVPTTCYRVEAVE